MKKLKISINDEIKECDLLYTFKSDNTNKDYLICTDNTYNKANLKVYSFIYYPKNKGIEKIVDEKDWKEVKKFIDLVDGE